ncbi:hypothetical protein BB560_001384 [Smittium megazygosporum]|uniref:Cyclin C-terminal domain-containing protein n=1 Tax=Smittium megazygosporum TaxID=133381 RepID=A0A2T9ZHS7_9FUNG|nr:hypothetical protein BB560_001384 [Smittium megazygosporum]
MSETVAVPYKNTRYQYKKANNTVAIPNRSQTLFKVTEFDSAEQKYCSNIELGLSSEEVFPENWKPKTEHVFQKQKSIVTHNQGKRLSDISESTLESDSHTLNAKDIDTRFASRCNPKLLHTKKQSLKEYDLPASFFQKEEPLSIRRTNSKFKGIRSGECTEPRAGVTNILASSHQMQIDPMNLNKKVKLNSAQRLFQKRKSCDSEELYYSQSPGYTDFEEFVKIKGNRNVVSGDMLPQFSREIQRDGSKKTKIFKTNCNSRKYSSNYEDSDYRDSNYVFPGLARNISAKNTLKSGMKTKELKKVSQTGYDSDNQGFGTSICSSENIYSTIYKNGLERSVRYKLIEWLCQIDRMISNKPQTLPIAVNIVDRFSAINKIEGSSLNIVGAVALYMSAKYNDSTHLTIDQYVAMLNFGDLESYFSKVETDILRALGYDLAFKYPISFSEFFSKIEGFSSGNSLVAKYIIDSMLNNEDYFKFAPGDITAIAIYIAYKFCGFELWDEMLCSTNNGYQTNALYQCKQAVYSYLRNRENYNRKVFRKYNTKNNSYVSSIVHEWANSRF